METSERKTFEKKVLPDGKPILMTLSKPPREGKPSNFQGQEKAMIGFMFRVSDNKYLELVGYPVFVRTGAWISGGDNGGRESNTHKLLEKMAGEKLPGNWDRIDARDISEEMWRPFFGDYVVRMKAPQMDEAGLLKWQDVDEVINPASIEFPVEYRKAEAPGRSPGGPLGLPKANGGQTPPPVEDRPQAPPEVEQPAKEPDQHIPAPRLPLTIERVDERLRVLITPRSECLRVTKEFLVLKKAPKVTELPEADRRHLLSLMLIVAHTSSSDHDPDLEEIRERVSAFTMGASIATLSAVDADLLRMQLDDIRAGVPF